MPNIIWFSTEHTVEEVEVHKVVVVALFGHQEQCSISQEIIESHFQECALFVTEGQKVALFGLVELITTVLTIRSYTLL